MNHRGGPAVGLRSALASGLHQRGLDLGYTLGIDLGTTFTAAAVYRDGRAEVVPLGNHAATIPSLVFLREDETVIIGDAPWWVSGCLKR